MTRKKALVGIVVAFLLVSVGFFAYRHFTRVDRVVAAQVDSFNRLSELMEKYLNKKEYDPDKWDQAIERLGATTRDMNVIYRGMSGDEIDKFVHSHPDLVKAYDRNMDVMMKLDPAFRDKMLKHIRTGQP